MVVEQDVQQLDAVGTRLPERGRVITRASSSHPTSAEALLEKCRVLAQNGCWAEVEGIAASAASAYPAESAFYTQLAWAVYRQDRTIEASELVMKAAERFPTSVGIAYSAACLNGALRRATEARRWLAAAIERASNPEKVKLKSLVQPELQCLWD